MNWLGLTIFVLLPLIGAVFALRSILALRRGVQVPGIIVGYYEARVASNSGGYTTESYPKVTFRDAEGNTHTVTMSVYGRQIAESKRKPVKIVYPKGKPEEARIADFASLWMLPLVFFVPALILVALVGIHKLR